MLKGFSQVAIIFVLLISLAVSTSTYYFIKKPTPNVTITTTTIETTVLTSTVPEEETTTAPPTTTTTTEGISEEEATTVPEEETTTTPTLLGLCPSVHIDNGDGTCTAIFFSEADLDGSLLRGDGTAPFSRTDSLSNIPVLYLDAVAAGQALNASENGFYIIIRGFISFDTSSIPSGSGVTKATLNLKTKLDFSYNDFLVEVVGGTQPLYGDSLDADDWNKGEVEKGTILNTSQYKDQKYFSLDLPVGDINIDGRTQYLIRSDRDGDNKEASGYEYVSLYSSEYSGDEPYLEVTYISGRITTSTTTTTLTSTTTTSTTTTLTSTTTTSTTTTLTSTTTISEETTSTSSTSTTSSSTTSTTTTITPIIAYSPIGDASVTKRTSGGSPDTNYGSSTNLQVRSDRSSTRRIYRSFLKFDLTDIPSTATINSAKLWLYRTDSLPPAWSNAGNVDARKVNDDTWSESTITWNNQPSYGDVIATTNVNAFNTWFSWDLTSYIQEEVAGDKIASLVLRVSGSETVGYRMGHFSSKENTTHCPYLEIYYSITPPTTTSTLTTSTSNLTTTVKSAYEIDPYDADVDYCTDSKGKVWPATGPGSASWFVWNGCAHNKYYYVNPGEKLRLHIRTDKSSCIYPNFYVHEYQNETWVEIEYFDLPDEKSLSQDVYYTPNSDRIMISSNSCFYLDVFSPTEVPLSLSYTSIIAILIAVIVVFVVVYGGFKYFVKRA